MQIRKGMLHKECIIASFSLPLYPCKLFTEGIPQPQGITQEVIDLFKTLLSFLVCCFFF